MTFVAFRRLSPIMTFVANYDVCRLEDLSQYRLNGLGNVATTAGEWTPLRFRVTYLRIAYKGQLVRFNLIFWREKDF